VRHILAKGSLFQKALQWNGQKFSIVICKLRKLRVGPSLSKGSLHSSKQLLDGIGSSLNQCETKAQLFSAL
jgi:hypothetical protein